MSNPSQKFKSKGTPAAFVTILSAFACMAISALCFSYYYIRYLKWDFNELGRYYDAEHQIVYTTSAGIWISPALAFLMATLILALLSYFIHRRNKGL